MYGSKHCKESGKLLIKIKNKKGRNKEPCGTPLATGMEPENLPRTRTFCVLLDR